MAIGTVFLIISILLGIIGNYLISCNELNTWLTPKDFYLEVKYESAQEPYMQRSFVVIMLVNVALIIGWCF